MGRTGTNFLRDSYLLITVKDKGLVGNSIFLGEAFIALSDIVETDMDKRLSDLPQMQLPLTRPCDQGKLANLNPRI